MPGSRIWSSWEVADSFYAINLCLMHLSSMLVTSSRYKKTSKNIITNNHDNPTKIIQREEEYNRSSRENARRGWWVKE